MDQPKIRSGKLKTEFYKRIRKNMKNCKNIPFQIINFVFFSMKTGKKVENQPIKCNYQSHNKYKGIIEKKSKRNNNIETKYKISV